MIIIRGWGEREREREREDREETISELQRLVHRQGQLAVFGVETGVVVRWSGSLDQLHLSWIMNALTGPLRLRIFGITFM